MTLQFRPAIRSEAKPITLPVSPGLEAIVDADAPEIVFQAKWYAWFCRKKVYVRTQRFYVGDAVPLLLHRLIMNAADHVFVDHINGNSLDNRRHNLRFATKSQNCANAEPRGGKSRFKGVSPYGENGKFRAGIMKDGKNYHLGVFEIEEDAAFAYDRAAKKLFGRFAHLNFGGANAD